MNLFASTSNTVTSQGIVAYSQGQLLPDGTMNLGSTATLSMGNDAGGALTTDAITGIDNAAWSNSGANSYDTTLANNGFGSFVTLKFSSPDNNVSQVRAFRVALQGATWAFYQSTDGLNMFTNTTSVANLTKTYGDELIGTSVDYKTVSFSSFVYSKNDIINPLTGNAGNTGYMNSLITDDLYYNTIAAIYNQFAQGVAAAQAATNINALGLTLSNENAIMPVLASDVTLVYDYAPAAPAAPVAVGTNVLVLGTNITFDGTNYVAGSDYVAGVGATPQGVYTNSTWQGNGTNGVEYMINYDGTQNQVAVTYYGKVSTGAALMIPAVCVSDGSAMSYSIPEIGYSSVTPVRSPQNVPFTPTAGAGTKVNATIASSTADKYQVSLGNITFSEQSIHALKLGWFYINAPTGYHFTNTNVTADSDAPIPGAIQVVNMMLPFTHVVLNSYLGQNVVNMADDSLVAGTPLPLPTINPATQYNTPDYATQGTRIYFQVVTADESTSVGGLTGKFDIAGLIIAPNDPVNTPYGQPGDVITAQLNDISANINSATLNTNPRVNWNITYSVTSGFNGADAGPAAVSYSGWANMGDASNLASVKNFFSLLNTTNSKSTPITVTFQENVVNSWWLNHNTSFTLVDSTGTPYTGYNDVKFSSVNVTVGNVTAQSFQTYTSNASWLNGNNSGNFLDRYTTSNAGIYFNSSDTSVMLYNLVRSDTTATSNVVIKFTLSAQADFTGDVYLKVDNDMLSQLYSVNQGSPVVTTISNGASTPLTLADGTVNPTAIKVASFQPTVTITTTNNQLQIGYQNQTVSNIDIQENAPGMIQANALIQPGDVSPDNMIDLYLGEYTTGQATPYMYFGPGATYTVNTADSGLNVSTFILQASQATGRLQDLQLVVSAQSTKAAGEITIQNLIVNVDRTVPYGNYDLIVGGKALTDNSVGATGYNDRILDANNINQDVQKGLDVFPSQGIVLDNFISIATPGANLTPFTFQVDIVDQSDTATVTANGQASTYNMGCQAYIDSNGNMMVPMRFTSYALGVADNDVVWDGSNQTCTVFTTNKIYQFKVNSTYYTVNGTSLPLIDASGNPVAPVLTLASDGTYRMFLPFRAFGNAFGIPVGWDPDTSTATYNPSNGQNNAPVVSNN
jgi:hypothetical protein